MPLGVPAVGDGRGPYDPDVPNLIPETPEQNPRAGQTLRMASLAPQFDEERHQLYYDMLVRAVNTAGTYNVAVTGAYGTGKSSVLDQLRKDREDEVVALSLSTIAAEHTGEESRTNQIQKEIVKQLLYRLPTRRTPRSRFRRTSAPDRNREWAIATWTGLAIFAVAVGLGLVHPVVQDLFDNVWRRGIAYVLLAAAAVAGAWIVASLVRGRPALAASVNTGPATVTLSEPSEASESYFDKYLDEIVYFFQVSQRHIVVIEDIDRFDHVQVFDTLRALNSLLNSSEQIGRRVVFVYAIRDSVFEQIGAAKDDDAPKATDTDRAKATLKLASRTKFFDVIIPVVPFVSADNARDLMSTAMESDEFTIDPALIRLAARHVADMRMIHNIRNEFEVYRQLLVVPERRMPGINDTLVFAIVLFKNTHLGDFEKIRHQESTLDRLYSKWRQLVRENISDHMDQLTALRQALHLEAIAEARAGELGRRLIGFAATLGLAARATSTSATAQLVGVATEENAGDRATWASIASGEVQQITITAPAVGYRPGHATTLAFSTEHLAQLLGTPVDPAEWQAADLQGVQERIAKLERGLEFLRHHTWEMLCQRPELTLPVSQPKPTPAPPGAEDTPGEPSFDDLAKDVLESDLARDLVRHGFLTSHFALYASSYYGKHLGPDAAEYVRRCIEPGTPDPTFPLDDESVDQILREQDADKSDDADLFSDVSVYNVSIIDYLLEKRVGAARAVARKLSRLGEHELAFVDTYAAQGKHPARLLAAMTPTWPGVVRYVAATAPVDAAARVGLLDAVLRAMPNDGYEVDAAVRQLIETSYRDIEAITQPGTAERAGIVLRVVKASGAALEELEPLNDRARNVAIDLRLYPITDVNLLLLAPDDSIALDALRRHDSRVYSFAVDRLADYLVAFAASPATTDTVTDTQMFEAIVTDAAETLDTALLGQLVASAGAGCRVRTLARVPADAWPFLVAGNRTDPTLDNVQRYIGELGLDGDLGTLIARHKQITADDDAPEADRHDIAVMILNARGPIPDVETRVAAAASLRPGTIPATAIKPEKGDLIAQLLASGLIADDADAFSADLMVDWTTFEAAIAASENFATFVSPDVLDASQIPNLLRSPTVPKNAARAVVNKLADYLTGATPKEAQAVAEALVDGGWQVRYTRIEALRVAGANTRELIQLVAKEGEDLTIDHLKALLHAFGGSYSKVAKGGLGRPHFENSQAHVQVLGRLINDTISKLQPQKLKAEGPRLVAQLQYPRP